MNYQKIFFGAVKDRNGTLVLLDYCSCRVVKFQVAVKIRLIVHYLQSLRNDVTYCSKGNLQIVSNFPHNDISVQFKE